MSDPDTYYRRTMADRSTRPALSGAAACDVAIIGAQLGMATPFLLVLAVMGAWAARRRDDDRFLLVALIAPALVYFLIHALHDRVQGNWPAFLYPMLAILAAKLGRAVYLVLKRKQPFELQRFLNQAPSREPVAEREQQGVSAPAASLS